MCESLVKLSPVNEPGIVLSSSLSEVAAVLADEAAIISEDADSSVGLLNKRNLIYKLSRRQSFPIRLHR